MTGELDEAQLSDGQLPAHDCIWQITGTQLRGVNSALLSPPQTIVAMVCMICHLPITVTLTGHWTEEQLKAAP